MKFKLKNNSDMINQQDKYFKIFVFFTHTQKKTHAQYIYEEIYRKIHNTTKNRFYFQLEASKELKYHKHSKEYPIAIKNDMTNVISTTQPL